MNTSSGKNKSVDCLLLDRFISLLSQLSGKPKDIDAAANELCQTFDGSIDDIERHHIYFGLAEDSEFMLKFSVLQMAKQHNLYG